MAFIQIDEDLHNLASIARISFSEYPGYTGQWRADVYFRGDDEAYLTLPHTFTSPEAARLYAAVALRQAERAGVCTEEDLAAIAGPAVGTAAGVCACPLTQVPNPRQETP